MASCNKDPRVSTEGVTIVVGTEVVCSEDESIISDIFLEDDILGILLNRDVIAVKIVLVISNIGNLEVVECIQDGVHVDILGLLEDGNIKRGFNSTWVRGQSATDKCAHGREGSRDHY